MNNNIKILNGMYFAIARELALQDLKLAHTGLGLPKHFSRPLLGLSLEEMQGMIDSLSVAVFRPAPQPSLIARLLEPGANIENAIASAEGAPIVTPSSQQRLGRLYCHAAREMATEDTVLARVRLGLFDPLLILLRDMPLNQFWSVAGHLSTLPFLPRLPLPLLMRLLEEPAEANRAVIILGAARHAKAA